MARDDEFRKVAEDVGALARSLARDFREAVDQARSSGRSTGEALRHGIRGVADETRRGVTGGWQQPPSRRPKHHHHRRPYYYPGPFTNGNGPAGNGTFGDPDDPLSNGSQTDREGSWQPDDWAQRGSGWALPGSGGPPAWVTRRAHAPRDRRLREEKQPKESRRSVLPPVRRRWDATTVAGVLAVLFGVAWLLGALHLTDVSAEAVVAVGLMFLGAALIVTGRTDWSLSRRSWPVWLGVGLIGALLITSSTFGMGGSLQDVSFGTMNSTVSGPGNHTVHGGFGKLTVDAAEIRGPSTLTVDSVAGQTTITFADGTVPPGMAIDAKVLAGQICVDGRRVAGGISASYHRPASSAPPAANGTTGSSAVSSALDVHQVAGQIQIGSKECSR